MLTEQQKRALAESIVDCIESALTTKFGDNIHRVIFANLDIKFGLKRKDVASHPEEFEQTLDEIFGTGTASGIIKRSIFNELANRFQIFGSDYYERDPNHERIISKAIKEILHNAE